MHIYEITGDKKQYLDLLLLADEQEDMVDKYLDRGIMFVLDDEGIKGECVVTDEGNGVIEIKNLAVHKDYHGRGYGKALIRFIADRFHDQYSTLQVGTGDSPITIPFYEHCGFKQHHRIKNFILDNYDRPIYEGGVQLRDMVFLRMKI